MAARALSKASIHRSALSTGLWIDVTRHIQLISRRASWRSNEAVGQDGLGSAINS